MMHSAADIRRQIKHPIVDGDGHWVESFPILLEYVREVGGPQLTDELIKSRAAAGAWYQATPEERQRKRIRRPLWWGAPARTYDRATIGMPALLRDRLDEFGIDFAFIYTSIGLTFGRLPSELQACVYRAYNRMAAETFAPYPDRFAPAAMIPTNTPEQAIAEAEYAVHELGLKVIMVRLLVERDLAGAGYYVDTMGLDSPYDWDPFWQKCVDLGVAVTAHNGGFWVDRTSTTNYTFNHTGHFAQTNHTVAKAIFLGGVPHRFPTLNFAFLEGGVGWARHLYSDLVGHWEKRNLKAARENLSPRNLDPARFRSLATEHGYSRMRDNIEAVLNNLDWHYDNIGLEELADRETEHIDDFAAAGILTRRDIDQVWGEQFYYGCEADDPLTGLAFDRRLGVPMQALFSSDIGHFDVLDISEVVPEAYELVEHELITVEQFEAFTFSNTVKLHGRLNPGFFDGTRIGDQARTLLGQTAGV